jgi:hypothetical protein
MDTSAEAMRANDGKITHGRILEWLFGRELGQEMMMGVFFGTRPVDFWEATDNTPVPRFDHTTTLLAGREVGLRRPRMVWS